MSALADKHHSSYYAASREQSLRRSFIAIHHPPSYHSPIITTDDIKHGSREENVTRSDRRESNKNAVIRNKSRSSSKQFKFNRRGSLATSVAGRTSNHSGDYYELTPLPFSKDGTAQSHRESSQERLPTRKEFQRSYSPLLTAAMAQEIAIQLTSENQLQL